MPAPTCAPTAWRSGTSSTAASATTGAAFPGPSSTSARPSIACAIWPNRTPWTSRARSSAATRPAGIWRSGRWAARSAAPLAGIIDLAAYHDHGPDECGGPGVIDALVGAGARNGADVYADTSPPRLLPLGAPQTVISGALDHIVPSAFGAAYGRAAAEAGDAVQVIDFPHAGHFELIDPTSQAWPAIRAELLALLG